MLGPCGGVQERQCDPEVSSGDSASGQGGRTGSSCPDVLSAESRFLASPSAPLATPDGVQLTTKNAPIRSACPAQEDRRLETGDTDIPPRLRVGSHDSASIRHSPPPFASPPGAKVDLLSGRGRAGLPYGTEGIALLDRPPAIRVRTGDAPVVGSDPPAPLEREFLNRGHQDFPASRLRSAILRLLLRRRNGDVHVGGIVGLQETHTGVFCIWGAIGC